MDESSEVKAAADDTHVGCEDLERKERPGRVLKSVPSLHKISI